MIKDDIGFVDALKCFMNEYGVRINVIDNYGERNCYIDTSIEISSDLSADGTRHVYIDDIEELAEILNE